MVRMDSHHSRKIMGEADWGFVALFCLSVCLHNFNCFTARNCWQILTARLASGGTPLFVSNGRFQSDNVTVPRAAAAWRTSGRPDWRYLERHMQHFTVAAHTTTTTTPATPLAGFQEDWPDHILHEESPGLTGFQVSSELVHHVWLQCDGSASV